MRRRVRTGKVPVAVRRGLVGSKHFFVAVDAADAATRCRVALDEGVVLHLDVDKATIVVARIVPTAAQMRIALGTERRVLAVPITIFTTPCLEVGELDCAHVIGLAGTAGRWARTQSDEFCLALDGTSLRWVRHHARAVFRLRPHKYVFMEVPVCVRLQCISIIEIFRTSCISRTRNPRIRT